MKKFLIILFVLVFALVLVRSVINPTASSYVPIMEVLQKLKTMDLPFLDMVQVFTDEYNDIADILDMTIGDWGSADGVFEYIQALANGVWLTLKSFFYVMTAPFVFLYYTVGTIVEVLRVLSLLLF